MQDLLQKLRGKQIRVVESPIEVNRCEFCGEKRRYTNFGMFAGKTGHQTCIEEYIRIGMKLDLLSSNEKKLVASRIKG